MMIAEVGMPIAELEPDEADVNYDKIIFKSIPHLKFRIPQ